MKNFLKELTFTKKSIFITLVMAVAAMIFIAVKVGFEDLYHIRLSIIIICLIFLGYIIYVILVLASYYHLPRNRRKNQIGVLFIIDTHGSKDELKALKNKFVENFQSLARTLCVNELNPIILSQKKMSVRKGIFIEEEMQKRILVKTKCVFAVFMKSINEGNNSSNYQLNLNLGIVHPKFDPRTSLIFNHNLNLVLRGLNLKTLDKNKDLQNLQSMSSQLYCICQLLYGVANTYAGNFSGAIQLLNSLLCSILNRKNIFYEKLKEILYAEIFSAFYGICSKEYGNFLYDGSYNIEAIKKFQPLIRNNLSKLPQSVQQSSIIIYHLYGAITLLLEDNILGATSEINALKKFKKIPPNERVWEYSRVFLIACRNDKRDYLYILKRYITLKNNYADEFKIRDFMIRYLEIHPDNLGVKLALFSHIQNHDNLDDKILPNSFRDEILKELEDQALFEEIDYINQMNKFGKEFF